MQLFSNGMRESEQRHVTLRINASGNDYHFIIIVSFRGPLYFHFPILYDSRVNIVSKMLRLQTYTRKGSQSYVAMLIRQSIFLSSLFTHNSFRFNPFWGTQNNPAIGVTGDSAGKWH